MAGNEPIHFSFKDLFYIGMGPSSSHTIGPMKAAKSFVVNLSEYVGLSIVSRIDVYLYGSLALTGKGHHTDKAVLIGLMGEDPESVDLDTLEDRLSAIHSSKKIALLGKDIIPFDPELDIHFLFKKTMPHHANGLKFKAFNRDQDECFSEGYYSIGGGSIVREDQTGEDVRQASVDLPYPFSSGQELLDLCDHHSLSIEDILLSNERLQSSEEDITHYISSLWEVMKGAVERAKHAEGVLPGGLNVKRRAPELFRALEQTTSKGDGTQLLDYLSAFAIATNEENAAGGRVVTAPTNGASGVIPAVLMAYEVFYEPLTEKRLKTFFLTAGAIGLIYKQNVSISGAEMGCQGEVGVACSMAAAGLAALMGGTPRQIECAAEIGMEHNLGLTCDPIKGLVQIPCIERNSMGAVKAVNAARLGMSMGDSQKISLDRVIKTMRDTGRDMKKKYKETSKGGLALHNVEC